MIRSSTLVLLAIGVVLCASCHQARPPTASECRELLNSNVATKEEMLRFIERSKQDLESFPDDQIDAHTEGLGLCTGALMLKAGVVK